EEVLVDADSSLDNIFFPDSGVVSVAAVYPNGSVIEMGTIGREGCAGVQAVFGEKTSSMRLFARIPGAGTKMSRASFERGDGGAARVSKSDVRLSSRLSRADDGIRGVQRCTQRQGTARALAPHDAGPQRR